MNPFRRLKTEYVISGPIEDPIPGALLIYGGLRFTLDELARFSGLPRAVLKERLRRGWAIEDAVLTAMPKKRPLAGPGEEDR